MNIDQLNHVAIDVADVPRSCDFYGGVLGLEPKQRPAFSFPGAWFALGPEQELHLIEGDTSDVPAMSMARHFALRVPDIQAAAEHLRNKGVEFSDPKARPDGVFQIFLRDPDGHTIELSGPAG